MVTVAFWMNQLATASTHWAATKFEQLNLGDARLNKRARVKTIWLGMKEVYVAAKTMEKLRDRANAKNCV